MTTRTLADRGREARSLIVVALCALGLWLQGLPLPHAHAFSNPHDYGRYPTLDPTQLGGGAGRFFTGSPADGYGCDVCHSARDPYSFPVITKGLPEDGYIPGKEYRIEVSWPQASAAEQEATAKGLEPLSELVAEFISDEGGSAGTVSFDNNAELSHTAFPGLYCPPAPGVVVADNEWPQRYPMSIFAGPPGKAPEELTLLEPGDNDGTCTVPGGDDQNRCILAVKPCGAQLAKFTWTAPKQWRGPIWFSAGFVITYDQTGEPNDFDYVTMLSIPLNPAYEGSTYQDILNSGCSVSRVSISQGRGQAMRGVWFAMLIAGVWFRARRRRQTPGRAGCKLPLVAALTVLVTLPYVSGCNNDSPTLITRVSGAVGLYEPMGCEKDCEPPQKCRVGAWQDAGMLPDEGMSTTSSEPSATDTPSATAGSGSAVVGVAGAAAPAGEPTGTAAGTPVAAGGIAAAAGAVAPLPQALLLVEDAPKAVLGSVAVNFTSTQKPGTLSKHRSKCGGDCSPNFVAAWIEDENRRYVRTLYVVRTLYSVLNLTGYYGLGVDCQKKMEVLGPDVVVTATPKPEVHRAYNLTWDGTMGNGEPAPAGEYRLRIEVVIDEDADNAMPVADIPFSFGEPLPMTVMAPPMVPHTGVTISYTPAPPTP